MTSHPNQEEQVRELLDAHGEYYVRQTMQFIKDSRTDSPVMGGANKKDTESLKAILALLEQAETAAALKVWEYIAATPEWDIPIHVLDEGEEHIEYDKSYIPPKPYVDEMIAKLKGVSYE